MGTLSAPLVSWTSKGMHCEAGGFYIDPHRGVDIAVVTHAHSDHARRGSRLYICESSGVELLKSRLGRGILVEAHPYGERFEIGGVTVSLHSAGHILGSAQVRVEHEGEVWVASGDYKREPDPSCEPFEVVKCETFITEATFGTPKFKWEKGAPHGARIAAWWAKNATERRNSLLFGYSLGKAQRILAELAPHAREPIWIHRSITELTECYRRQGRTLAPTRELVKGASLRGSLILAPPSVVEEGFAAELGEYRTAFASGWMSGSGGWNRGKFDDGFVLSDHADWEDLNRTIAETGARRVFVQHRNGALIRHLRRQGVEAHGMESLTDAGYAKLGGMNLRLL